jgi:NDP-sugar pyrophosphorylase family protein
MEVDIQIEKNSITAFLLCGGKGERLRPLTNTIPKPLIKIKKKPILQYVIDHILKYNINKLVVATGYQSQKIEKYLDNEFEHSDLKIIISDSGCVDIIKRLKDASHLINGDFIIFYGDTLSDVNIHKLAKYHKNHTGKATITVWPLQSQFGLLEFDDKGMICSFKEKPVLDMWVNIGYIYCEHSILSILRNFDRFEDLLNYLVENKEMNGYKHKGIHITVNTIKELKDAEENIDKIG